MENGTVDSAEAAEQLADAFEDAADAAKSMHYSSFEDAADMIDEIDQALADLQGTGEDAFSADSLDGLIGEYPELLTMMDNQAQLEQYLTQLKGQQVDAQSQAYQAMLENSTSYWNLLLQGNEQLRMALEAAYGSDAASFRTIAQLKADVDTKLRQGIEAEWTKIYSGMGSVFSRIASAIGNVGPFARLSGILNGLSPSLPDMSIGGTGSINLGGGGSGGGSSSSGSSYASGKTVSALESLLDRLEQEQAIVDFNREMASLGATLHENRGELQGVILYLEKEKGLVEANVPVLKEAISTLEDQIAKKKQEISSLQSGTEAYNTANEELGKLQDAHQEYNKELLQSTIDIEEFNKKIKEQQDAIRDMQIDIRDTIEEAIRDREELNERMLQGQIEVENAILDVIRARYEKERDEILETSEARKEALEEQKDLIDEQLELRKQAEEEEDKQKRLAELERQLALISIDPTRAKESAELQQEIADLRNEIAWDTAEKEADAQKESIDEQIQNIEDYMEYIENYYDEMFTNQKVLIDEMKKVIALSDEEIVRWLMENSEEYKNATAATQQSMRDAWEAMLMDMRGETETYWDEVEQIIAGGDEAIIEFLKQNSADYKEAGKLQAEAYVDEWLQKLEDLRNATKVVQDTIKDFDYVVTEQTSTSGGGSSSGGSGGSGGGGKGGSSGGNSASISKDTDKIGKYPSIGKTLARPNEKYVQFAHGGVMEEDGIAFLHAKERVLPPAATKVYDELLEELTTMRSMSIPVRLGVSGAGGQGDGQSITIGDINVNVDKLETDEDYAVIGEKIMNELVSRVSRGMVTGGIRSRRGI